MARQKMFVIIHGVMRAKWIDPKHIFDEPDEPVVPVTIAAPEPEPKEKKAESNIIMVADEPGGVRRPVDKRTGKAPVAEPKPENPQPKPVKKQPRSGRRSK